MRPKLILFTLLFFFIYIPLVNSHTIIDEPCTACPPTCMIGCNEGMSGRDIPEGGVNWFNYTVFLNCNLLIEVTASGWGYYNLTGIWEPESCSGINSSDSGSYAFISNSSLSPGVYYFRVGEEFEDTCDIDVSCKVLCDECPPPSGCYIGCNQTYYDLKTDIGDIDVVKFSLNSYRRVNIEVKPHGWGYYNLTLIQDPNTCTSKNNQSTSGSGSISITNSSLPPGVYYFYVGHEDTEDLHNLTLTCSKIANGYPCLKGDDCQSGLCIEGICRAECNSTFNGSRCSDGDNNYTNDGICTRLNSGWYCDKQEASYYLSEYWSDCFNTSYAAECDPDSLAGGYSASGVCGSSDHENCCSDFGSDADNVDAPSICGSESYVCSFDGYYCDNVNDASWDPGNKRCDATDSKCRTCDFSTHTDDENLCESGCGASSNCDQQTPADYCPSNGTFCNSTCIEIDRDSSQTACEHSSATCTPYHWSTLAQFESNQPYCCGDDSNENWLTETFDTSMDDSSSNTNACCDSSNDCVDSSNCYSSGTSPVDADNDGDADYCLNGVWYDCYDDSDCHSSEFCQNNDCVPHCLIVQSTILSYWDDEQGKWITNDPLEVTPREGSNRTMNVTVNVQNSSAIDTCVIRIFNSTDSYDNPTIGPFPGTIQKVDSQVQCYGVWEMEYWRNPGDWNVSVDLNLTNGVANFTSKNFTYVGLKSLTIVNVPDYIYFNGFPGEEVNSSNAFPMELKNTGNLDLDIKINGTDMKNEGLTIGVENITFSENENGPYIKLTKEKKFIFSLVPTETKYLFFRMNIPIGFPAEVYQNTINIDYS